MEIFNINQAILASVVAGKEQNETNNVPEDSRRDIAARRQQEAQLKLERVQEFDRIEAVNLDPEKQSPRQRRRLPQRNSEGPLADEAAPDAASPQQPLGGHIDLTL